MQQMLEFPGSKLDRSKGRYILSLLILLLAGWTLFWRLGTGSFYAWDEATYAQIAREMVASGDWITPHWNGFPLHDKPPLMLWLMAAGMTMTKSLELAARFPCALAGLFAIGMTALLGRSLFCTWTGLAAATLLLVTNENVWSNFVLQARQGMLDVPLTGFTLWAFLHFWLGQRKPLHWLLIGIPVGLAILTKSFLAITIVLVIFVFILMLALTSQPLPRKNWLYAVGGFFVAGAISLPWHIVELLTHGRDFLHGYVLIHFMKTIAPQGRNTGDASFYLNNIRWAAPHLSWVAIPAVCFTIWRSIYMRDRAALFLVVWLAAPLLFFSLVPTKLPWYIVPILPAFALAIALLFRAAIPKHWIPETLFLGALVVLIGLWNIRVLKPVDLSPDVKVLGECVDRITPAHEQIAYYDPTDSMSFNLRPLWNIRPSVLFYANRPMIRVRNPDQLNEWAKQGGRFVWSEKSVADQIPASFFLIAQEGKQRYYFYSDGSGFPANCSEHTQAAAAPPGD